jgi:cobalt-zinc-cadmium efflux system membrane fusion protein
MITTKWRTLQRAVVGFSPQSGWRTEVRHGTLKRAPLAAVLLAASLLLAGCSSPKVDAAAEAPPPAKVEEAQGVNVVKVDHPEQFQVVAVGSYDAAPELNTTGVVNPDVSRTVPVVSLATGRVIEVDAKLGDSVRKGQLLLKVQSADISGAFSDYRQAVADEVLARAQLERSKILFEKGAIAQKDLEVAQDAEDKARVTVESTIDRLRVLGADVNHPTAIVNIYAPVSGVITDQQVTTASGVQGLASPNPFTISDLSHVWILCDVYENNLSFVRLGEFADVRLNGYPDRVFSGRIANIGPVLDPNTRTAKVRLELANPGLMRVGMFVTATFHGLQKQERALAPASAVLHLHDRDWVYVPDGQNQFRRLEVTAGNMRPGNMQEILSGLRPGDRVVRDALTLQNTAEQ